MTPSGGTPTVTKYVVDSTQQLSQVVADLDAAGNLQAYYVRAGGELLAVLRPAATTYTARYVHADGLGSVRAITDESGVVTDTRAYEAFGLMNAHAGTDATPYGFAGEAYEPESKLAYHRARWMDARVGRFLGMDPLLAEPTPDAATEERGNGLHANVPGHPFAYVSSCPVLYVDPTGLCDGCSSAQLGALGTISTILANMMRSGNIQQARSMFQQASSWVQVGFGGLSRAGEFGVGQYNQLRAMVQALGPQAEKLYVHHLLEARLGDVIGQNYYRAQSIVVTAEEHQVFTNAWRLAIPYGTNYGLLSPEFVFDKARIVYANYPSLLLALGL